MTQKELIERNIGLTFDYVNYLIDNKSELERLPDNFKLEFIEKDFPKRQPRHIDIQQVLSMRKQYVRVKNSFSMI